MKRALLIDSALILLAGALLFIPSLDALHLFDWDEANFAEATREMMIRGDYLRVTIAFEPFWEKPPLFLWLQALTMTIAGVNEYGARLVNALTGVLTLLVVYGTGRRVVGRSFGIIWAAGFAGSFLPHLLFKSGVIDPVFNLFIFSGVSLVMAGLGRESAARRRCFCAAGFCAGLAMLTKGPVGLLIVALTVLTYWGLSRFRALFRAADLVAFFSLCAGTAFLFYGIETISHGIWFIREFTSYQFRLLTSNVAGHGRPFYYHALVILFGCFPASVFAIRELWRARPDPEEPGGEYTRIMRVLFWTVLVVFSLVRTKTFLYSSLTYFPLTYLAALHLDGVRSGRRTWTRALGASTGVLALVVAGAAAALPLVLQHKESFIHLVTDPFAAAWLERPVEWHTHEALLGIIYGAVLLAAFRLLRRGRPDPGIAMLYGAGAVCVQVFLVSFAPRIEQYVQGGPVAFYKEHAGKDVYVRALFKSYADLFYGQIQPGDPRSRDKNWLLEGPIDRPAYLVAREHQSHLYERLNLTVLGKAYGYVYYRRDPPERAAAPPHTTETPPDPVPSAK